MPERVDAMAECWFAATRVASESNKKPEMLALLAGFADSLYTSL